jgi:Domain of unknown function (DUF4157)
MHRQTTQQRPAARRDPAPRWLAIAGPGHGRLTQLAATLNARTAPNRPSRAGMPEALKAGVEALSGVSLDGVLVHRNSARPAQLNALAYAQGRDIHLAPGQEKLLPHEAWHVAQQAQGRVRPTMQLKIGVAVNDDVHLEREADIMGAKALAYPAGPAGAVAPGDGPSSGSTVQRHVTFDPYLTVPFVVGGATGLAGYSAANIGNLVSELRQAKYATAGFSAGRIRSALRPFLGDQTICFKDYADAALWVVANAPAPTAISRSESSEEDDSSSDEDLALAAAREEHAKEDRTSDRRKGKGRKRDAGTARFKKDGDFRAWVHGLKQHNQLETYGIRNRLGGDDNLTIRELKTLEAAYDSRK